MPIEISDDEVQDVSYEKLTKVYEQISGNDIKLLWVTLTRSADMIHRIFEQYKI